MDSSYQKQGKHFRIISRTTGTFIDFEIVLMNARILTGTLLLIAGASLAQAGERSIVSLRDMKDVELRSAGISVPRRVTVHITALGGGGDYGWTYKTNRMFAYGWIINADNRELVWKMGTENTSRTKDDRSFDGTITLEQGNYEVYFTAYAFEHHTTFTHITTNVDHRESPLFKGERKGTKGFFSWLTGFWSDDLSKEWDKRSRKWGIDMLVDESVASTITPFAAPKDRPGLILKATGLKDRELIRRGISLSEATPISIYALGEESGEGDIADGGWIVSAADRHRVWEMTARNTSRAGGAKKNVLYSGEVTLPRGDYVLYYITDGTHSAVDWNDEPPYDPLNWGVSLSVKDEKDRKRVRLFDYEEDQNLIVSITKVHDNEYRTEGFTLKEPAPVRIYAFGERNNSRRSMADYGLLLDAKTRSKVWTMDVDQTYYAGGASKNRFVDEVIPLQRGSYIVSFTTDDSHSYEDWNDDVPFDPDHYGISVMGAGEKFNSAIVAKYVEARDKNIVAQIVRVGDDADRVERFSLGKTTRLRIYAIGEGRDREMYDYGWIEDAKTGNVVWEMTYGMTFYAGGGRKNRMVNTTLLLEKGEYRLHWRSDDSHSYAEWNVEPPEDPQYWGITLYRDEGPDRPAVPGRPEIPEEPDEE